jgi:hypothetical protein
LSDFFPSSSCPGAKASDEVSFLSAVDGEMFVVFELCGSSEVGEKATAHATYIRE